MSIAKRSTSIQGLPSQNFDGRAEFVAGFPRQGKTRYVLKVMPEPFLFACTDVSNQSVKKLPYVEDTDRGLDFVLEHPLKTMAIRCFNRNPRLLSVCRDHRRAVCLDEIGNLMQSATGRPDQSRMGELVNFMREVGYCDEGLQVWATSQRAESDVWPAVYTACRRITWVGPLAPTSKMAKLLWSYQSDPLLKEEVFLARLQNLKRADGQNPNFAECTFTVKDI